MTMLDETLQNAKHVMGSVEDAAGRATGAAKDSVGAVKELARDGATGARTTWLDGVKAFTGVLGAIRSFQSDDALGWLGLARRRSPFASYGLFGAGLAVGAGLGVLFAPASGNLTRQRLRRRFEMAGASSKTTPNLANRDVSDLADTLSPSDGIVTGLRDAGKSGTHRASS